MDDDDEGSRDDQRTPTQYHACTDTRTHHVLQNALRRLLSPASELTPSGLGSRPGSVANCWAVIPALVAMAQRRQRQVAAASDVQESKCAGDGAPKAGDSDAAGCKDVLRMSPMQEVFNAFTMVPLACMGLHGDPPGSALGHLWWSSIGKSPETPEVRWVARLSAFVFIVNWLLIPIVRIT